MFSYCFSFYFHFLGGGNADQLCGVDVQNVRAHQRPHQRLNLKTQ